MTDVSHSAQTRLAVYGTLAPGEENHHHLADLAGDWYPAQVRGRRTRANWGEHLGYPGLVLDPSAGPIEIQIFQSHDLPDHWDRLDFFEGQAYRRMPVTVTTGAGEVEACIYEVILRADNSSS